MPEASTHRASYAASQAAVVGALMRGTTLPEFDSGKFRIASHSLRNKRRRSIERSWPVLLEALGAEQFTSRFAEYADATPLGADATPLADGYHFGCWLSEKLQLPRATRIAIAACELRNHTAGKVMRRRTWPSWKILVVDQQIVVAVRIPAVGEWWNSFRLQPWQLRTRAHVTPPAGFPEP